MIAKGMSQDHGLGTLAAGALSWHQPCRLLGRPVLLRGQLRVQRQAARDRPPPATKVVKVVNLNATRTPRATSAGQAMRMGGARSNLMPGASAMPKDVRLTPDGTQFLVADMLRDGIWVINARNRASSASSPPARVRMAFTPTAKAGGSSSATACGIAPDRRWPVLHGSMPACLPSC